MKVKAFTLMLFALIAVTLTAQKPTSVVLEASVAPVIDGEIDAVWADAPVEVNNLPFGTEVPTAEATWQGLWTREGIYLLVIVTDDNFYPHYMNTANPEWEMDKLEIYFDVNLEKNDALGASSGKGPASLDPSPAPGRSILMTSAPSSASRDAQYGPAM